jgi:hypothetical protein
MNEGQITRQHECDVISTGYGLEGGSVGFANRSRCRCRLGMHVLFWTEAARANEYPFGRKKYVPC